MIGKYLLACQALVAEPGQPSSTRGSFEWVVVEGHGTTRVYDTPPETTAWQCFTTRLLGAFVPAREL